MADLSRDFVFINGDEAGKVTSEDQKLVRSRSKPRKYRRQVICSTDEWIAYSNTSSNRKKQYIPSLSVPLTLSETVPFPNRRAHRRLGLQIYVSSSNNAKVVGEGGKMVSTLPRYLPLIRFAEDLDSYSLNALQSIYPGIERAFSVRNFGISTKVHSSQWRQWLLSDIAYLHAILAASSAVQDVLQKKEPSRQTHIHISKALAQLRKNISTVKSLTTDVTVAGVVALCIASLVSFDRIGLTIHGKGLREIIRLRGGLKSFHSDPQFMFIMTRIDLCLFLTSAQLPLFQHGIQLPPPTFVAEYTGADHGDNEPREVAIKSYLEGMLDPRVFSIFAFLQSLSRAINSNASTARTMTESDIHTGITTAQYQLLQLENQLSDILSECMRITLLAFITTTLQILQARISYAYAADELRQLSLAVESSTRPGQELMFWILMIGSLSFFDHNEAWLREKWRSDVFPITRGLQWGQAKQFLKKFIWIDQCNTHAGEYAFQNLNYTSNEYIN